jgi:hypothetical protein
MVAIRQPTTEFIDSAIVWRLPNHSSITRTRSRVDMFAAANRLLVNIDYRDQKRNRATRAIEAYSLRRSRAGDIPHRDPPELQRTAPQRAVGRA